MIEVPNIKSFGRVGHYERKGLYAPSEIFPFINGDPEVFHDFDGDPVRMSSARYTLFAKNQVCVRCGVVGTHFAKERAIYLDRKTGRYWPTSNHFHFNLYGINKHGHEVMMTKDHILPRAHGGKDEQANYQTMCAPCNGRKRDRLPNETEAEYSARRAISKKAEKARNALLVRGHYIAHMKEAT